MNHLQVETIFLNLIRQTDEFVSAIVGHMPDSDSGSFHARLMTLFNTFAIGKTTFSASSYRLGQLATLINEYDTFTTPPIDSIDRPEIVMTALDWDNISNVPEFFTPVSHFHKWEEISNKPIKYLPVNHRHSWGDLDSVPATFPPSEHTHPAPVVTWADVTDKPALAATDHSHPAQPVAWVDVTDKPTAFPAAMPLPDPIKLVDLFVRRGQIGGPLDWSSDGETWHDTFPPNAHTHVFEEIENFQQLEYIFVGNQCGGAISLFPDVDVWEDAVLWQNCDGGEILRNSPAGWVLGKANYPYGVGDGSTTCNKPTLSAPVGFVYKMYVGRY